ncbi:putative uncharacterized protein [Klebsiella variicola CAG:634]|nr:putative uncharacterized protein [Klebsiella variicola CAG:634]
MDHAVEDGLALFLPTQTDLPGQSGVAIDNRLRAGEGFRADFAAGKAPAVLVNADQGIDEVGTRTNIKDRGLLRHLATILRQQIRQMMNIIGTPGHRRTEKTVRNVPVFDRVEMRQQRFIQRLYCLRIGKINGLLTQRIERNVSLQVRMCLAERRQVVALMVAVTRV